MDVLEVSAVLLGNGYEFVTRCVIRGPLHREEKTQRGTPRVDRDRSQDGFDHLPMCKHNTGERRSRPCQITEVRSVG